jgi:acetylornithine/N-succinyldiaminopimelate aminotransferase
MSAVNATLDVMLAPGFFDHVKRIAIVLRQRLAEIKDRYPALIAEVRAEGLLVGLRMLIPAGEMVDALRAENMLTVGAGDNVVRLLPPLIVSEQEIAEGIARLDRACARLNRPAPTPPSPANGGGKGGGKREAAG